MRVRSPSRWAVLLLGTAVALAGCKPQASAPKDRVPPNPSAPARYGPPTGVASKEIPRALPPVRDTNWQSAPFWILHTELSPGILVHSKTRYLGLFADLAESGLGAPAHVAWSTKDGPRPFKPGTTHEAGGMEENWLLVWFAGATNWTNWDSPWAVFLQHKPTWLRLDERGLHLEFAAQAGDVVVMPLYGYFKLPPQGRDYLAEHGLKSRQLFSWQWEKSLARDPLTRLRYWAGASREFPIYCEETFSVDRARDGLTVRSRIEFHSIRDDWKTKPVKLAPVSPALALAARDKDFPARFSKAHFDMELPTPFGPYAGVQDADTFDVTFPWLHYVNETEVIQPPDTNAHPMFAEARAELRTYAGRHTHIGTELAAYNYSMVDLDSMLHIRRGVESSGRALAYLDPELRERLKGLVRELLLKAAPPWSPGVSNEQPGLGYGAFQALWAYGHYGEDWDTVRTVWTRWRPDLRFKVEQGWATFGRPDATFFKAVHPGERESARVHPGAADYALPGPAEQAALARVAYRMGDLDLYHYASLRCVQGLTDAWNTRRGGNYFRKRQPWDSMAWIPDVHSETNIMRVAEFAWSLFNVRDADVARFHRDHFSLELRRELDWLVAWWKKADAKLQLSPSLTASRSLLLNEGPAELARVSTPGWFYDRPHQYLTVLRAGHPPRFERLIPPAEASAFVTGLEREPRTGSPSLISVTESTSGTAWPQLLWPQWKSPGGGPWSFGRIKPVRDGQPASAQKQSLNWNTEVVTYTIP